MASKYQKLQVGTLCLIIIFFGWDGQAQDLTTRATGCLDAEGNLSDFALGDDPLEDCANGDDQVSFRLDDLSDGAASVPFFVTLRFGEEQVVTTNGALELRARCRRGSGISGDTLQLIVTSTLDGWLATSAGRSTTRANLATDEVVLFAAQNPPGQGRLTALGSDRLTGAQLVLAPDGSFLSLASGSTALGVNLFGQDCLAVGTADLIQGDLPAPGAFGNLLPRPGQVAGTARRSGITVGIGLDDRIAASISSRGASGISALGE